MIWSGVMPAMTTPFDNNLAVDHPFLAQHAAWLLGNGCIGLVMLAAISSLSTANAVRLAKDAEQAGCQALMVLPPYVYTSDWREMKNHVSTIIAATGLSCMLYNNPVAYKTDFLPAEIAELAAEHANLHAVKESSADVRRVSAIREVLGDRLHIFVGVDDVLVEGVNAGAKGWVAGLVNAYPAESVELFKLAQAGKPEEVFALYRWFLPLLRMDTVPKFVQLIKWVQERAGVGSARVRAPRMEIVGKELETAQAIFKTAVANRPKVQEKPFTNFKGA